VIYGAGAIGGTIGAHLTRAGTKVWLADRDVAHTVAMRTRGLHIQAPDGEFTQRVQAILPQELTAPLDGVFLCTKQQDTEEAVEDLAPLLAPDGWIMSVQNGLQEPLIAEIVGPRRTVGCFVNFSADVLEPGVIRYAGPSAMAIGELDGTITPRLTEIRDLLSPLQPVEITEHIQGYLWSKIAYGGMLFAAATTDAPMAECVEHPRYRWALLSVARELVDLAARQGLPLFPFDGWDPGAVHDRATAAEMLDGLAQVMRRSVKVRTGVWRDLATRRRKTEADAEFLPVFKEAERLSVELPVTRKLVEIIHSLEDGSGQRGWHNLETLYRTAFPEEAGI